MKPQPCEVTAQSLFDSTYLFLRSQGKRSALDQDDPYSMCMYRHPKGLKCAVGFHIPDEIYDPSWEGKNVYLIADYINLGRFRDLLGAMQAAHDNWTKDKAQLREKFEVIAKAYKLDKTVLAI